jgi:hypothetical protein
MPKEPSTPTAVAALVKALAELQNVGANKTVKANFTARYVSLDVLLDAIKPILAKYDLALRQQIISEDGKVGVLSQFIHADGTVFEAGRLLLKAEGLTPQQVGSLVTYSRRITASTAAGISVDTDDDGAAASRPVASAKFPKAWTDFIPTDLLPKAQAYVVGKGWLQVGQALAELSPDHVAMINANQTAFLNVIRR